MKTENRTVEYHYRENERKRRSRRMKTRASNLREQNAGETGVTSPHLHHDHIPVIRMLFLTISSFSFLSVEGCSLGTYGANCNPCPTGSYQDGVSDTCKPCGIGTYQGLTGQSTCSACSSATWYGTTACSSSCTMVTLPTQTANVPGTASLLVGTSRLTFNCPSGTYSAAQHSLVPLTSGCSFAELSSTSLTDLTSVTQCPTNTCCIWASSQLPRFSEVQPFGTFSVRNGFDGLIFDGAPMLHTNTNSKYVGIDFGVTTYVDSIILFDRIDCCCYRENGLQVYIGDTLVGVKYPTTTSTQFPIGAYNNLCYSGGSADQGYRIPSNIPCKNSGRYLYIVGLSTEYLNLQEVIVLGEPACTQCPGGTYSFSTIPTTSCSNCPSGTWSPAGSSSCSLCSIGKFSLGGMYRRLTQISSIIIDMESSKYFSIREQT